MIEVKCVCSTCGSLHIEHRAELSSGGPKKLTETYTCKSCRQIDFAEQQAELDRVDPYGNRHR